MTALAEKMKSAGVDTLGSQLTAACFDAIRQNPDSAVNAWNAVGQSFGYEFVRGLIADMRQQRVVPAALPMPKYEYQKDDPGSYSASWPAPRSFHIPADTWTKATRPCEPRVIPEEQLEKRRKLQEVVRSKYKHSGGVSWSDVSWHELTAMTRDGNEASALLAAGPANVPNDGRTVGDVLGVKRVDEIIEKARG